MPTNILDEFDKMTDIGSGMMLEDAISIIDKFEKYIPIFFREILTVIEFLKYMILKRKMHLILLIFLLLIANMLSVNILIMLKAWQKLLNLLVVVMSILMIWA